MTARRETLETTDWTTLFRAFAEALEWALDRAADLARAYPQEVATVERVRTFARKSVAGDRAHLRIEDLLFALGLIAGALERQLMRPKSITSPQRSALLRGPAEPDLSITGSLGERKPTRKKDEPVRVDVLRLRALE